MDHYGEKLGFSVIIDCEKAKKRFPPPQRQSLLSLIIKPPYLPPKPQQMPVYRHFPKYWSVWEYENHS